jgi:ESS family glutamate:Na+ symporter
MILVAMWFGSAVTGALAAVGAVLPVYIGAMIVAAALRRLDDLTGWLQLSPQVLNDLGNVALSFFLVLALMTLDLSKLATVAAPLAITLIAQTTLVAIFCWRPLFARMGGDYDAAVMAGGFCGFMLGTTANAVANMDALAGRYGPAPRAYLVVPIVGAFFIDFANALLIQACLTLFG